VIVVLLEVRFFVLDVAAAGFFAVDLAEVLATLDVDLLTVFAGVLLTVFAGVLLVVREAILFDCVAVLRPDVPVVAIASIRGAGCFLELVARTSLMALVCCSRVILNSWCPSLLATKYR